jgi:hypothetical protein
VAESRLLFMALSTSSRQCRHDMLYQQCIFVTVSLHQITQT